MYKTSSLTEEHEMVLKWPNAVSHDGINTIFVSAPDDLTGCFVLSDDTDLSEVVSTLGSFLPPSNTQPVVASKANIVRLYRSPEHRLWAGQYEDKAPIDVDHNAVFGVGVDMNKDIDTLKAEVREQVRQLVSGE